MRQLPEQECNRLGNLVRCFQCKTMSWRCWIARGHEILSYSSFVLLLPHDVRCWHAPICRLSAYLTGCIQSNPENAVAPSGDTRCRHGSRRLLLYGAPYEGTICAMTRPLRHLRAIVVPIIPILAFADLTTHRDLTK